MSDNDPQFLTAYNDFCEQWGIRHTTSSPRYPQSNGFVERQVRYIKPIIKKTIQAGGDINKALLNVRATPLDSVLPSPAELMFGRAIPTALPSRSLVRPNETFQKHLSERADSQKAYADRHTKALPPLHTGQHVRVLNKEKKQWYPATVTSQTNERSYMLETEAGRHIRRNRRQLREITSNTASEQATTGDGTSAPTVVTDPPLPQCNNGSDEPAASTSTANTTRAGRAIRKPQRFNDYTT